MPGLWQAWRRYPTGLSAGSHGHRLAELIPHAGERRMLPVLDLDPVPEPAGAIEAVAMLRDQPFETHQAGLAEQVRSDLALLEVGEVEGCGVVLWIQPRGQRRATRTLGKWQSSSVGFAFSAHAQAWTACH